MENLEHLVSVTKNESFSVINLVISTDSFSKLILITLIIASIFSWGIIINKLRSFSSIRFKMLDFEKLFWSGQILDELYEKVRNARNNPLASVFVSAFTECKKNKINNNSSVVDAAAFKTGYRERVIEAMYLAKNREIEDLQNKLGFLATVGSSAPFIGLLGTVWGIMHSFQSIANSKNTTLAVVAPGITEALLATAVGLFVAIPAIIFYNILILSINDICNKTDDFIGELKILLTRAIDEGKM